MVITNGQSLGRHSVYAFTHQYYERATFEVNTKTELPTIDLEVVIDGKPGYK
jgi:hypothetical protein